MRDNLKVSFVMCGYKCDQYINRAIESILDQDYTNYEIIVNLNGLWDDKEDLIKFLKEKFSDKIKLLSHDQGGLGRNNNIGFEHATGDVISHLQSDLYLMPGALRNWVEAFEDNPESGLVYSGYKLVSPNPMDIYYSNSYDRYHHECEPFVDGASPVRREYWKRWDEELKSLIDWDWTLSVTEANVKPIYIKEPLYYAELPKEGGLSDDSSHNWIRRKRMVQDKHNIPDRPICIASIIDPELALGIAKITGNDFRRHPGVKPHDYRLIYCYGFMCGEDDIQRSTSMFFQHFGHKIIHWSGPDINSLFGTWNINTAMYYVDMVLKRINQHWVTNKRDDGLLRWIHLEPEQQLIPVEVNDDSGQRLAISVNDPDLADQLRKAMPDQEIVINDVTAQITVHFDDRITNITHSLCRGNYVIANQNLPGTYFVEGFTNVPELRKMTVHTIRNILRVMPEVNKDDIKEYRAKVNPDHFKKKLQKIAEKEIKKYSRLEDITANTKGVFN